MKKRTTLILDSELVNKAKEYAKVNGVTALIHEALKNYIQLKAAIRLASMGGTEPAAKAPPRRRSIK